MKLTKTTIKGIAKKANIDLSVMNIYKNTSGSYSIDFAELPAELAKKNVEYGMKAGENLPEVKKMIKKYNQQAKKLVKAIGIKFWGMQYGDGTWHYELNEMNYSTRLALDNID